MIKKNKKRVLMNFSNPLPNHSVSMTQAGVTAINNNCNITKVANDNNMAMQVPQISLENGDIENGDEKSEDSNTPSDSCSHDSSDRDEYDDEIAPEHLCSGLEVKDLTNLVMLGRELRDRAQQLRASNAISSVQLALLEVRSYLLSCH